MIFDISFRNPNAPENAKWDSKVQNFYVRATSPEGALAKARKAAPEGWDFESMNVVGNTFLD